MASNITRELTCGQNDHCPERCNQAALLAGIMNQKNKTALQVYCVPIEQTLERLQLDHCQSLQGSQANWSLGSWHMPGCLKAGVMSVSIASEADGSEQPFEEDLKASATPSANQTLSHSSSPATAWCNHSTSFVSPSKAASHALNAP